MLLSQIVILWIVLFSPLFGEAKKVLICGLARNIEHATPTTIANAERLGTCFSDYAILIYENNSTDKTAELLSDWTKNNPRVHLKSENTPESELSPVRTIRMANARNQLLNAARHPQFYDFKYLIMVDLDFLHPWPVEEIVRTIEGPGDWDCIAANGLHAEGYYYDRYAFLDENFPFGPEMLGIWWWGEHPKTRFTFSQSENRIPVYAAFGGLAIYKKESILPFSYSGVVTEDLAHYYKKILVNHPQVRHYKSNPHLKKYFQRLNLKNPIRLEKVPIQFVSEDPVTCCEHNTLHAAMAMHGRGKFFINSKMIMRY